MGWRLVTSQPIISDPVNFKGLPLFKDGHAEFLPFGDLLDLMETTEETLWFFDDLIQAPTAVQAALMQLFIADAPSALTNTRRRSTPLDTHPNPPYCPYMNESPSQPGTAVLRALTTG
jgi:hypothetical protein